MSRPSRTGEEFSADRWRLRKELGTLVDRYGQAQVRDVLPEFGTEEWQATIGKYVEDRGFAAVQAALMSHGAVKHTPFQAAGRFAATADTEGMDNDELPEFYDHREPPPVSESLLAQQVSDWAAYCGRLWSAEEREDLVGSCFVVAARSAAVCAHGSVAAALYTMMVTKRVVWAAAEGSWLVLSDEAHAKLEPLFARGGAEAATVALTAAAAAAGLPEPVGRPERADMEKGHPYDDLFGAVWTAADGGVHRLVRFDNTHRGHDALSPLHDTVAWLRPPASEPDRCFHAEQHRQPPAGVLETLLSLSVYDNAATMPAEFPWLIEASLGEKGNSLAELCLRERNQKAYSSALFAAWKRQLEVSAPAPRLLAEGKIGGLPTPTPAMLLNSIELQWLRRPQHPGSPPMHAALSGNPKLIMCESDLLMKDMQRLEREAENQPYWSLNQAMRNTQQGRHAIHLQVGGDKKYAAKCPQNWLPSQRLPPLRCTDGGSAQWDSQCRSWMVAERGGPSTPVPPEADVTFEIGTLMLHQVKPLLQHLDIAIHHLRPVSGECPQRLYRGLAGVQLDAGMYSVGKVVMWGQFSSSSADMSVATGFTSAGSSAVFSIVGGHAIKLARMSRFAREREWLYPASTLFAVDGTLSDEFARMLGKQSLQLFELRVVTRRQALALRVRNLLCAVRGDDAQARVGGLFKIALVLDDDSQNVGHAADLLLSRENGTLGSDEALVLHGRVCRLAQLSPRSHASSVLRTAASKPDGDPKVVEPLVMMMGADPNDRDQYTGDTPLHLAAACAPSEFVEQLLQHHANPFSKNLFQKLPCDVAADAKNHDSVRVISEFAPLPRRLGRKYAPIPNSLLIVHLIFLAVALALNQQSITAPVVRCVATTPELSADLGEIVGTGHCRGPWGVEMVFALTPMTSIRNCYETLALPDVTGVNILPSPETPLCRAMISPRAGGMRQLDDLHLYNTPVAAYGPAVVVHGTDDSKKRVTCWRKKAIPKQVSFAYTHLAAGPPGDCSNYTECGFAPEKPRPECTAQRTVINSTCGAPGPAGCPASCSVLCPHCANSINGSKCCAKEQYECQDQMQWMCPTPEFFPCIDREECDPSTCMGQGENLKGFVGVDCPATCGCPGSIKAEFELPGAQSLLIDGLVATRTGGGCINLTAGVRLDFERTHKVSVVELYVHGSASTVQIGTADGGAVTWQDVTTSWTHSGSKLVAYLPGSECTSVLLLRTSARVCEISVDVAEDCGSLYSVSTVCAVGRLQPVRKSFCAAAGDSLGRTTMWKNGCYTQIPSTQSRVRDLPVCVQFAPKSSISVSTSPGACAKVVGSREMYPFFTSFTTREGCQGMLSQWGHPRMAVAATFIEVDWGEDEQGYCLVHVSDVFPGPGIGQSALIYTTPWNQARIVQQPEEPSYTIPFYFRSFASSDPPVFPKFPGGKGGNISGDCVSFQTAVPYEKYGSESSDTPDVVLSIIDGCRTACSDDAACAGYQFHQSGDPNGAHVTISCCFRRNVVSSSMSTTFDFGHFVMRSFDEVMRFPVFRFTCFRSEFVSDVPNDYRVAVNSPCPAGTTADMSVEECGQGATKLNLPVPPVPELDDHAPHGCTLTGRFRWTPSGMADKTWQAVTSVCKVLQPVDEQYSLIELATGQFGPAPVRHYLLPKTQGALTATCALFLACLGPMAACGYATYAAAAKRRMQKVKMKMKMLLIKMHCVVLVVQVGFTMQYLYTTLLIRGTIKDLCGMENRSNCSVEFTAVTKYPGWSSMLLGLNAILYFLHRRYPNALRSSAYVRSPVKVREWPPSPSPVHEPEVALHTPDTPYVSLGRPPPPLVAPMTPDQSHHPLSPSSEPVQVCT
eukprot:TRINITY_DN2188_c2_g1_i1.p1 TRINITY_DN2188_c2_g1~~TRINITY_DN2188_c2_g1_i1.p1  ORF type:complete len:1845 (+),score=535.42 TRINITY_DN2188_c2_g1_i1:194-5728(+)